MTEDEVIRKALDILEERSHHMRNRKEFNIDGDVGLEIRIKLARLRREEIYVVYLDMYDRPLHWCQESLGTTAETVLYPREVARRALEYNAVGIVVFHNHPQGAFQFSEEDIAMTASLEEAVNLIGVSLVDHFLVVGKRYLSLRSLS